MKRSIVIAALLVATGGLLVVGQQTPAQVRQGLRQQRQTVQQQRARIPRSPILDVLDANKDGVIDKEEIAQAAEALKKLDKNGDGKLTPDEYLPPRGPRTQAVRQPGNQGSRGQGQAQGRMRGPRRRGAPMSGGTE